MGSNNQGLLEKLNDILGGIAYLVPEGTILVAAIVLLLVELVAKNWSWQTKTGISAVFVLISVVSSLLAQPLGVAFGGALVADPMSGLFQLIFLATLFFSFVFPRQQNETRSMGEYHFVLFSLLLGAFLMTKSANLLVFYLSLELMSIPSYILTAMGFRKKGFEAGIKYLLFGALASGVMLYGMSLLYGLSGSLALHDVFSGGDFSTLHLVGTVLMLAGVFFKLSVVPMHIWTPDVYDAAPTPVVAVFSVVPKLAVLVFVFRAIAAIAHPAWQLQTVELISVLAIVSMFFGNLAAIWQTRAKRMMAYSSIAHAGFLIIGAVVNSQFGFQSIVFYAVVYTLMNLGVFYFVAVMEQNGRYEIDHYWGVGKRIPIIGGVLVVLMISLTGLPPTGGFSAKFLLFSSLWEKYETTQSGFMLWLFIAGLVNTVIALFYYLKIPYISIFKSEKQQTELNLTLANKFVLVLITILLLLLFFKADLLFDLTNKYNFAF